MSSYTKEDPQTIRKMFSSIAPSYDRTNALLSFQMHRLWNRKLAGTLAKEMRGTDYLDLCSGTGDIAFRFLSKQKEPHTAHLLDFCPEMLACAEKKAKNLHQFEKHTIHFLEANAEKLPLPSTSVDGVSLAYGIRNIKNTAACLSEVFRVLKPGGVCIILELTRPKSRFLQLGHKLYLKTALPLLGRWATANGEAYRYLSQSITAFTPPEQLCSQLTSQGFESVQTRPLTGGIATLFIAKKT